MPQNPQSKCPSPDGVPLLHVHEAGPSLLRLLSHVSGQSDGAHTPPPRPRSAVISSKSQSRFSLAPPLAQDPHAQCRLPLSPA